MLKVSVNYTNFKLEMTGHAGYAELDKDIVCAGASMLFYALADTIQKSREYLIKDPEIEIKQDEKDINAVIKVEPKPEYVGNFSLMYEQTLNGLRLLAEAYPKNVAIVESEE